MDRLRIAVVAACLLAPVGAGAQSATNLVALRGLAPVSRLLDTPEGRAALAANLGVTGDIQTGALHQPLLLPFADQQHQALADSFITDGNAAELADGLGTTLAGAYRARARYDDAERFTSISPSVADLIAYTNATTKSDSNAGKYFFANATTDGKAPVSAEAAALLATGGAVTDVFGRAYDRVKGSAGAGLYGDSRPFQTEPRLLSFRSADYFGKPSHSLDWLRGPSQNLTDSPSYPSGHTTYGYTESLLLAILVPERYQQMIVRAAEYGNDRIIMGAHYAMDVIGGRTLALHDVAHLLANDPAYVGRAMADAASPSGMGQMPTQAATLTDYRASVAAARTELTAILAAGCGAPVAACAAMDSGRFRDASADAAFYAATQTNGLPAVHRGTAGTVEDVAAIAPEAGHLLTAAFPSLTLKEADDILTATEGPGGGFLDDGSAFGLYSRLDLHAAAGRAAARAAGR